MAEEKETVEFPENEEVLKNEEAVKEEKEPLENSSDEASEEASTEKEEKNKKDSKYKKENKILSEANKKLEKELEAAKEQYMRLAAEYDNFRKRSAREKEGIYADASSDCISALLPVVDNLERALLFPDSGKVVDGVRMTLTSFSEVLSKLGVEVIEAKTFDPNFHNAVMHIEDDSFGEGEIVEVFQKGYKKGDKVIRYAMVKVAN